MYYLKTMSGSKRVFLDVWGHPLPKQATPSFIGAFTKVTPIASTVPANGDVNPYGVAVIPESIGNLVKGNILVSNFNNSANLQGQGTTIVQISPAGKVTTFAILDPTIP